MTTKICTIKKLSDSIKSLNTAVKANHLNLPLNHITSKTDKLQLALQRGRLWRPGIEIKVSFVNGGSQTLRERILVKAKQWERFANVRLVLVNLDGDIRIMITDSGSSWSYIGTDHLAIPKKDHTMEFGWLDDSSDDNEINRVVVHEFGHALGCIHEHQNPSASIPWDKPKVYAYYAKQGWDKQTVDGNLFETYEKSSTNFSMFDRESIMLYAIPEELTIGDYAVGWNTQLSTMDKEFIGTIYPTKVEPPIDVSFTLLSQGKYYNASISKPGEIDIYEFTPKTTEKVIIETAGNTDVVMSLLDESKTKVLNYDDDGGGGRNAKIVHNVTANKKYYVVVKHYKSTGKGGYRIRIVSATK